MRRREFFWLALGITLLVPFVLMMMMASFSVTEFAIVSGIIVILGLTVLGRYFWQGAHRRLVRPTRVAFAQRMQRPAMIIGVGMLGLAVLGIVLTLSMANTATPAGSTVQTPPATSIAAQPTGPREVNSINNLTGGVVGALVGVGILLVVYFLFSQHGSVEPAHEEPPLELHAFDWQEMLAPDDETGDDSDVTWWVQQLSDKDDRR